VELGAIEPPTGEPPARVDVGIVSHRRFVRIEAKGQILASILYQNHQLDVDIVSKSDLRG
jgi:hypothetical protein